MGKLLFGGTVRPGGIELADPMPLIARLDLCALWA